MKSIPKSSQICMMISAAIMVLALILSIAGLGVNYGIDFAGGLNIKYQMNDPFEQADVEAALRGQGVETFSIAVMGEAKTELQIRVKEISDEGVQGLRAGLEAELVQKYPNMDIDNAEVNYVGPVAGQTLLNNAFYSVLIAALLMLAYIAIRFDLNSGIAAVAGLVHDVLIMLSFMVLLRSIIQMNSSFIAAMLTIVGYSINNTIVIFDRIRENHQKNPTGLHETEIAKKSVKECLGRTINTTLTTLITIVTLYILGVDSIKEFALPIIIGILSGVYSANMLNGYVWAALEDWKKARKLKPKKA